MSDDNAQQEPSMEDILASIRRILSEDEQEEQNAAEAAPPPPPPPVEEPEEEVLPIPEVEEEDLLELADQDIEPEDDLEELLLEPEPEPEEDVLELGPDMQVEPEPQMDTSDLIGVSTAAASTAALSELSNALARDRGVGVGRAGITLEEIVRDSLRPYLKEWLDHNLPYLIERLVKAEIEKMVNRAERR